MHKNIKHPFLAPQVIERCLVQRLVVRLYGVSQPLEGVWLDTEIGMHAWCHHIRC